MLGTRMASVALAMCLMAYGTAAQAQDAAADETGYTGVDEIVVTAQKRVQGLADVPISISVVSGEQLERSGVSRVEDLYAIAPSLSFSPAQSSSGAGLRIRGVGSAAFGSATEPSVSTIVDGMVTGPGGSALVDLFDVERIEVLRGPQGTLFGKNSSAGAVNIVSRGPTEELSGYFNARYGDTLQEVRLEGAVGGRIGNGAKVRVAGYVLDQGKGQVWNPVRKTDENKRKRWGTRLTGEFESGSTTFRLTAQYEEQNNACCRTSFYGLDPRAYGALTRLYLIPRLAANGVTPGPDNRISLADGPLNERTTTLQLVANVSHEFSSGLTLRSITGYRSWYEVDTIDVDGLDVNIGNDPRQQRDLQVVSQELQLVSPDRGAFQWVLGAYFYSHVLKGNTVTAGGAGTILGQSSTRGIGRTKTSNYALYADGTLDLGSMFQLFAGVRGLYEDLKVDSYRSGNYFAFPAGTFQGSIATDDTNWVGRAGIRFTPAPRQSFYLSVSRGYKGRAIDNNTGNLFYVNPARAVLKPETVLSFELGARTSWFRNRLVFNATAFYSDFSNYQASSFDNVTSSQILRNAGKLRSQGFEADIAVVPWKGASFSGGLAYVDAIYKEYVGAPCTSVQTATATCPVGGQNLSGKPLSNNPKWQYNVRGQQDFELGGGTNVYVRGEYNWRDAVIYGGDLNPATRQKAFGVANFRAGVAFAEGKYELSGFVENAFDESYALRIYDSPGFTGSYSAFFGPARTWGGELRVKF
ncbi:TonB-dependent receptor [Sphingomonas sp. G-3-2-10]|uniref:TonB-dependent receptor n=1 Tax=Sphingomonas sp. G-3-2-10 TaxID=2728838 RepID=UPI00146D9D81|nr:TonB-dependent receptor [Sphingomonas sp. G-3-2-10]NML06662.1 TonB-dependent receptor [Sphingomonas sp. G-3-2-10]